MVRNHFDYASCIVFNQWFNESLFQLAVHSCPLIRVHYHSVLVYVIGKVYDCVLNVY